MFSTLPHQKSRLASFGASLGIQVVAVTILATITFTVQQIVPENYQYVQLVSPAWYRENLRPSPASERKAPVVPNVTEPLRALPTPPTAESNPIAPASPAPHVTTRPETSELAPTRPARQVQPSGFSSSAQPTISNRLAAKVQTGGFGDTNGVPANTNSHGPANIAAVGSFDLPSGSGLGNGSGDARGVRGVIPSAGFGNGIAQQGHPGTQIHIQSTDFGSIGDGSGTGIGKRPGGPVARPKVAPVEILSKPAPTYTEEARDLHIEGEVVIQVVFTSTAEVRVIRVLKGLGHGLDEAAIHAVQKIRFTPAKQDSEYIDSPATLHIVFQLS